MREEFIRAILANRDDDNLRTIYADWLDDHGESERAEFIRVQCGLARTKHNHKQKDFGGPANGCEACRLQRRQESLWGNADDGLGRRMLDELPGTLRDQGWSVALRECFRRGFVERVVTVPGEWRKYAGDVLLKHPVRGVTIVGVLPWQSEFKRLPLDGNTLAPWEHPNWPGVTFRFEVPSWPTPGPWQVHTPIGGSEIAVEPGEQLDIGDYVTYDDFGRARRTSTYPDRQTVGVVLGTRERGYRPGQELVRVRLFTGERWATALNPLVDVARQIEGVCRGDGSVPDGYRIEWLSDPRLPEERPHRLATHHLVRQEETVERRQYLWLDRTFQTTALELRVFQRNTGQRQRETYSLYLGRCDECRVAYFAGLRREPEPEATERGRTHPIS